MWKAILIFALITFDQCVIEDTDEPCKIEEYYNDDNGEGFNCYS